MKASQVTALIDAADELLAAQQARLPETMPEGLRELAERYLEARAVLLYRPVPRARGGLRRAPKSKTPPRISEAAPLAG